MALLCQSFGETELSRRWQQRQEFAPRLHALGYGQPRPAPVRREQRVVRDDPCPCGCGRKHERCCLPRERAERPSGRLPRRCRRKVGVLPHRRELLPPGAGSSPSWS